MNLRHRHGDATGHTGRSKHGLQHVGRQAERAGRRRHRRTQRPRRRQGRPAAQRQGRERQHQDETDSAHRQVSAAPADRVHAPLQQWRPDGARQVIARCRECHRDPAPSREPQRGIGDQRPEHRRRPETPEQHAIGEAEQEQVRRERRRNTAETKRHRPHQHRHHDAKAVGEAAHQHAANHEADHGHGVRQRSTSACRGEFRLDGRDDHDHRPHRHAADGADRDDGDQPQPGAARINQGVSHGCDRSGTWRLLSLPAAWQGPSGSTTAQGIRPPCGGGASYRCAPPRWSGEGRNACRDHRDHCRPVGIQRPRTARSPLQAGSTQKMSCNVIISRATRGSAMR